VKRAIAEACADEAKQKRHPLRPPAQPLKGNVVMWAARSKRKRKAVGSAIAGGLHASERRRVAGDSRQARRAGYGLAELLSWPDERGVEPHVKVFDKAERTDGTFSRSDFAFDPERNL
jgi:hypothetical protein